MPELLTEVGTWWGLLWPALAIAALRAADVSMNVFRVVFVVQGRRLLAALAAGLEAGIWLAAAGIVLADLTWLRAAGFVAGVALGTAIGVELTERLRLGMKTVRIYVHVEEGEPGHLDGHDVAHLLHLEGYRATVFRGRGYRGPVDMVLSTVPYRDTDRVLTLARSLAPTAFAAVDNSPYPAGAASATVGRV
ncbi:MAG: DUF5698 domain-containing protein [Nitriliruptoraceae bacterium]